MGKANETAALGIDGGASHLKWALRFASGELRTGEQPGANPQTAGWEGFEAALRRTVMAAVETCGLSAGDVSSAGLGLSGVGRAPEMERVRGWLPGWLPRLRSSWVGHDAMAALAAGTGAMRGIVLIAGSGSFCLGVGAGGATVRAGGWGRELGDEGSAFWIGRRALGLATMIADGRIEPGPLLGALLGRLGLGAPEELIAWANIPDRGEFTRRVASLAPLVTELAATGDRAATQVVAQAVDLLIALVLTVDRRLTEQETGVAATGSTLLSDGEARPLVLAGGLLTHDEFFHGRFRRTLECHPRPFEVVRLERSPALGALTLGAAAGPPPGPA